MYGEQPPPAAHRRYSVVVLRYMKRGHLDRWVCEHMDETKNPTNLFLEVNSP